MKGMTAIVPMTSPEPTRWTLHLAARRPARAVALGAILLLGLFAVAALTPREWGGSGMLLVMVISAVVLISAVAEFLFPVTYTLDADGVHARWVGNRRSLSWQHVRRVYLRPDGIQLSPLTTRGWVESYRGILLRTTERDTVLQELRAWWSVAGVTPVVSEDR